MFDGKSIMVIYQCSGGKHIKQILEECLNYQILHPESSREQVEAYLMQNKDKFMAVQGKWVAELGFVQYHVAWND